MKLLKTVKKIVQESEKRYLSACDGFTKLEELEKLEENYKNSLRLLDMIKKEKNFKDKIKK